MATDTDPVHHAEKLARTAETAALKLEKAAKAYAEHVHTLTSDQLRRHARVMGLTGYTSARKADIHAALGVPPVDTDQQ